MQYLKYYFIAILSLFSFSELLGQVENHYIRSGNHYYLGRNIDAAEKEYRSAITQNPNSFYGNFNLGDALYKKNDWKTARAYFQKSVSATSNPKEKADALHNIGCTFLQENMLQESVDAFQKSLIQNPKSNDTRLLLAYAQRLLKQNQKKHPQDANSGKRKEHKDMSQENAKQILKNVDDNEQKYKPSGDKALLNNW